MKRAFTAPPTDVAVIYEPRWYLDPETRPPLDYDLVRGGRGFLDHPL